MIIYLHGFDSTSPGNHEKVLQLQFIDPDVRFISYSTLHPRHDMQHLLKEVDKAVQQGGDAHPLICGSASAVLGGAHRLPVRHSPGDVQPQSVPGRAHARQDRPAGRVSRYRHPRVEDFREKNRDRCLVVLSRHDEVLDNRRSAELLHHYYEIVWDEQQTHKFKTSHPICSGSRRSRRWVNSFITPPRAALPVLYRRKVRLFVRQGKVFRGNRQNLKL